MNFDTIRTTRTYKYFISIGFLQAIGYSVILAIYAIVFAFSSTALGSALPLLMLMMIISLITVISIPIIPIIFLVDLFKPLETSEKLLPLWLEIICIFSYLITIWYVHKIFNV